MASITCARHFYTMIYPLSTKLNTSSAALMGLANRNRFGPQLRFQPLLLRAPFGTSHRLCQDRPQPPPEAPARPNPGRANSDPTHALSSPLLILRRITLAYLFSISACLGWSGIMGWYLVLNGRGDEVDERSPLRIAWDATRWPVDVSRRLLKGDE